MLKVVFTTLHTLCVLGDWRMFQTFFSGECLKFAQVALLFKLDVIYSKSMSNDVSVPSAEKIMLVDMYRESRYKDF